MKHLESKKEDACNALIDAITEIDDIYKGLPIKYYTTLSRALEAANSLRLEARKNLDEMSLKQLALQE